MSKFKLLILVIGVLVTLFGAFSLLTGGDRSALVFIFGGIVIASIGAGWIGKTHSEEKNDAG